MTRVKGVRPTIVYSILILFIQTVSFEIIQEITKKAGEKWNSMTDEDKAPYVAKAQATRLKWEKELQIYKHELKIGVSLRHFFTLKILSHRKSYR